MSDWCCGSRWAARARERPVDVSLGQLAATLDLVAIAIAVSVWVHVDLERDIAVAVERSFIQLSAVGLVINAIFEEDRLVFVIALITAMVLFGALTARNRARHVPGAFWPLLVALATAAASPSCWSSSLGMFDPSRASSCPSAEWWSATR